MKRTPLARSVIPFRRKTPLTSNPRKPIKRTSDKRRAMRDDYAELRARLVEHPSARCSNCNLRPHDLHHLREMSMGGAYTNPDNVVPLCRRCHEEVHADPVAAHANGLLVFEGDDRWEELGARIWRVK